MDDLSGRRGWPWRPWRPAIDRAGVLVDQWLDRVFAEPLVVPDAETAADLMSDEPGTGLLGSKAAGLVAAGLTRWLSRARFAAAAGSTTPAGWLLRASTVAVGVGTTRVQRAVSGALRDLQVLSSYTIALARAQGITLSRQAVQSVTVSVYVDDRRPIDHRYRGPRAGSAVATAILRESALPTASGERRRQAKRRVAAIDRLDLGALVD